MVGLRTLNPPIQVRILAREPVPLPNDERLFLLVPEFNLNRAPLGLVLSHPNSSRPTFDVVRLVVRNAFQDTGMQWGSSRP